MSKGNPGIIFLKAFTSQRGARASSSDRRNFASESNSGYRTCCVAGAVAGDNGGRPREGDDTPPYWELADPESQPGQRSSASPASSPVCSSFPSPADCRLAIHFDSSRRRPPCSLPSRCNRACHPSSPSSADSGTRF